MSDTPIVGATGGRVFVELSKYFLAREYPSKLRQCLEALSNDAVWARSNDGSNSIGNLLLHLAGNVRQWIVGGVGGQNVERDRASEFTAVNGPEKQQLLTNLESALREAVRVLDTISDDDLTGKRFIQGRETTVLGAIYHVVEHFAMHTGQIVLLTKIHAPGAIQFYDDSASVAKPLWKRGDDITED
ncbi:MAG: DUF1572 family protein [Gemmatimonadaceae bacterium]|nr:DUF1572 family protein [Gemmatimonadaceae bacterium]MBA3644634.1 DUF1572 family protein [Gemmatimonadaceae bacterium]